MTVAEVGDEAAMGSESDTSLAMVAGGIALVVLGILSLSKLQPQFLNSIGVIVGGIVALIESGRLPAQYARALSQHTGQNLSSRSLTNGMNAGVMAGGAAIVLGILAIIGIVPDVLDAVAVIALGTALLLEFVARTQVRALRLMARDAGAQSLQFAVAVSSSMNTGVVVIAISLIALGIIALAGLVPAVLIAIGVLSLGTYLFLSSSAMTHRLLNAMP